MPLLLALPFAACSEPQTAAQKTDKARNDAIGELAAATTMLQDAKEVSASVKSKARCVVVAPNVGKGAFVVGATAGSGVVTCRTSSGWSGPAFIKLSGASVGLQIGGQSSDVLMVVATDSAVQKLFTGNLKLGADASVAAGSMGTGAGAANETSTNAEIFTYARAKGAFAGVDFNGTSIHYDMEAAASLYGPSADVRAILTGAVPAPVEARAFLDEVQATFPAMGTKPVAAM